MSKYLEFNHEIEKLIKSVDGSARIEFGLDICKRLLPDYKDFEVKNKWGDSLILEKAVQFIESNLYSKDIDQDELNHLISNVDKVIPETEDFSDWDVSFALNASVSILELLFYLKDNDYSHILTISILMRDNTDFKIQMENVDISEMEIENHPLLVNENNYQLNLIKNGAQQRV
jgi:uncharacterized protein